MENSVIPVDTISEYIHVRVCKIRVLVHVPAGSDNKQGNM